MDTFRSKWNPAIGSLNRLWWTKIMTVLQHNSFLWHMSEFAKYSRKCHLMYSWSSNWENQGPEKGIYIRETLQQAERGPGARPSEPEELTGPGCCGLVRRCWGRTRLMGRSGFPTHKADQLKKGVIRRHLFSPSWIKLSLAPHCFLSIKIPSRVTTFLPWHLLFRWDSWHLLSASDIDETQTERH